jgi:hypothetical protein
MISRQYLKSKCFGYELQELCMLRYVCFGGRDLRVDEIAPTLLIDQVGTSYHNMSKSFLKTV